jgi:hypothetical protein
MTVPPTTRRAIAPPVAANPPEYVMSAPTAWIPDPLASSTRLPGSRTAEAPHVALRVTVLPDDVA